MLCPKRPFLLHPQVALSDLSPIPSATLAEEALSDF
jgi:hypothetical protein